MLPGIAGRNRRVVPEQDEVRLDVLVCRAAVVDEPKQALVLATEKPRVALDYRFEDQNTILRRVAGGAGSSSPYDWEGMLQALALRLHEYGLPASQGALVAEMQEWFVLNSNGNDVPDER